MLCVMCMAPMMAMHVSQYELFACTCPVHCCVLVLCPAVGMICEYVMERAGFGYGCFIWV